MLHTKLETYKIEGYTLKRITIGHKIQCANMSSYERTIDVLKHIALQHISYSTKESRLFKVVLRGLHDMPEAELKDVLSKKNLNCKEIKKITKTYQQYNDVFYIVYFEPGTVKLIDLKSNVKVLLNTIVRWEHQRRQKNKPVQCHNCQMYGHGERACNVNTHCANCAGDHLTINCTNTNNALCAGCGGQHKSTDIACPNRALYLRVRENIQRKQKPSSSTQRFTHTYEAHATNRRSEYNSNALNNNNPLFADVVRGNRSQSDDLFSTTEISQLLLEMLPLLRNCVSKDKQFNVITTLAVKYVYNCK